MTIRRFTYGRSHKGGIGMPAVTEHPEGEYVLYTDYAQEIRLLKLENDLWRNRTIKAEGKNANTTT